MKYKKEKYIEERKTKTAGVSFRVRIGNIKRTFNEADYNSASVAFQKAKAFRDQTLYEMSKDIFIDPSDITLEECFLNSFETHKVREETQRKLKGYFYKYIGHINTPLKDVTRALIMTTLNNMIEDASDDTITRVLAIWRRIYEHAILNDYVARDLTTGIKPPKSHRIPPETNKKLTDKQTLDEVINLLKKGLRDRYDRQQYPLMLLTLYYTGMRPAEMFALEQTDIKKGLLSVTKEVGSNLNDNNVIRQTKTALSRREIPIADELKPILKEACALSCNKRLIFADKHGGYHNSTEVGDRIYHITRAHGIKFNMYQLRFLFSTDLEQSGTDPRTHMELMGHKLYTTSIGYARSNDKLKKEALKKRKKQG